jgi:hypothetical protein
MTAATQAQAVAPLPNGLELFCLVVMILNGAVEKPSQRGRSLAS